MWNPFKKKDPVKEFAGVHHLAEVFFPQLVEGYNNRKYEEGIFVNIKTWKELLAKESSDKDFRFKQIKAIGSDFKNNHDYYFVYITWPEVAFPTSAKACIIMINRPLHTASEYILESSFGGSMVVKIKNGTRINLGITIPDDNNEMTRFTMSVLENEGILGDLQQKRSYT
jgi:hypothetical protein